jgi:hypothetical protein
MQHVSALLSPRGPGLTECAVEKQVSKLTAIINGHMNQHIIYARCAKIKEEEECDNDTGIALDNGVKTHCI